MSGISQFLFENAHILMWIIGLAIAGFIIMLCVVLITNRAVKKAAKGPSKPLPEKVITPPSLTRMPPPGGRLTEYLTTKGFFRVGELGVLFVRAIQFLRTHIGGHAPLYHLPWYLLIGPADAGKSTMLRNSTLKMPLGEPDLGGSGNHEVKWWFLNRGVILDVRGNFFINRHDNNANEGGWRGLLGLLARYRSKRPIDGIILTIPSHEFTGKNALSREALVDRAKIIAQKLHATQNSLGLQIPIYVVVSKADLIPGFKSFCQELPKENATNMLGWSNPYALSSAYNRAWLDQAFGFIGQLLSKIRLEIMASREAVTTRDGIFVLPGQLERIKDSLEVYIDHIFKESSYNEGLFLRGIYFTGDGASHSVVERHTTEDLREDDDTMSEGDREIYFVDDLIQQKIFFEAGLAQPIRQRVAKANRNLRIAKYSTAALVTVGTFGLMQTYHKFKEQNEDILPVLSKISLVLSQLQNIKGAESTETVVLFDSYAKQLIQMMHTLSESHFSSIFIPPSWFSPIQDNLNYSLKVSYNHIILRTIYIDLLLKGRELLYLRPTLGDRSTTLSQVVTPIESPEFTLLHSYVSRMAELVRMVGLFNELSKSNDIGPLRDLVRFTFKSELPKSFEEEFHNFRRVLRDVPFPPIDLDPYQNQAQETLRIIYTHFLEGVLSTTSPTSLIGRMNGFLTQFSQKQSGTLPDIRMLQGFAGALDEAVPKLGVAGKTWIDGDYFDLGPDFVSTIGLVMDTPLLGSAAMANELGGQTGFEFNRFKAEMLRLLPILSEEISVNPLADLKSQQYPSLVLANLHKGLALLFRESFMGIPPQSTLVTVVPENKIAYWDPKLIDAAEQMVKNFEQFKTKNLLTLPSILREVVILMAQQNLQANLIATIGRAQAFRDAPKGLPIGVAAEDVLREKILNVKEVAPKFTILLEALNKGGAGETFVALRNLMGDLAYRLLDKTEKAAMSNMPYAIKGNSFDWWDGNPGAIYTAYNVRDMDDLQRYFALQRDRMKHWAMDFAKYLVDFLSADIMEEAQFNRNLVDRWRRIIEQIILADQKKPDTSIAILENSLVALNDLTTKKCLAELKLKGIRESSGDFFVAVNNMVRREMRSKCEVTLRAQTIDNYGKLSDFFNERLKGKFPFVGNNLNANQGEAEPEDLREFFTMYKEFGDSPAAILTQVGELGNRASQPLSFLRSMEKIKDFFAEFLASQADNDIPAFDISVDFRVNKQKEQAANYIVDWLFKPSDETEISQHEKDRSSRWSFGNLTQFGFRWPESAGVAPTLDEGQKYMNVEDQTATFNFSSRWSLLWMIRVYGQPKPSQTEPSPYLMKFVIPLGPEKKAVVFNRVTLRAPAKGKVPGRIMDIPSFPTDAPSLSNEVKALAETPVLTQGKIIPKEPDYDEEKDTKKPSAKDDKKDKPEDAKGKTDDGDT
ncbi:MAG: hypothetical protein K2X98_01465 [Alphaproteobacteria bacterium]|nr:hypothetical protein [Alphaproteobacteria bacterium]